MNVPAPTANPRRVRVVAALSAVPLFFGASALAAPAASAATPLYYGSDSTAGAVSGDWAGWDVTGGTYTSVGASWAVPAVTCTAGETSFSANWIGLDGDGSESVEQTGTSSDCDAGTPTYSAWYEFYPSESVTLRDTVSAGDKMSSTVTSDSSGAYTLTLIDHTKGWTETKTGTAQGAQNASAEIITEAPSSGRSGNVMPLANFGTTSFTDITVDGKKLTDVDGVRKINMGSRSGDIMATTSDLTSDAGFSVAWKSAGSSASTGSGLGDGQGSGSGTGSGTGRGWPGSGGGWPGSDGSGDGSGSSSGTGSDGSGSDGSGSSSGTGSDGSGSDGSGSSSGTGSDGSGSDGSGSDGSGTGSGWPGSGGNWPVPQLTIGGQTYQLTPDGWELVTGSDSSGSASSSSSSAGSSTSGDSQDDSANPDRSWINAWLLG